MGKYRHIDHREPPREAGIPKIARNGLKVDYDPVPEDPNDPLVVARKQVVELGGQLSRAQEKLRIAETETKMLKQALNDAREESVGLRQQMRAREDEGITAERIEIVTVDEIERAGDTATVTALCDVDGHVDEARVVIPVSLIKQLIQKKRKTNGQPPAGAEGVPEVRHRNEGGHIPDELGDASNASGASLREVRKPSPRRDSQ